MAGSPVFWKNLTISLASREIVSTRLEQITGVFFSDFLKLGGGGDEKLDLKKLRANIYNLWREGGRLFIFEHGDDF